MKRAPLFLRVRLTVGVFVTLFALTLRGDTVELKTGERVDGAFRQASAAGVVIEVAGQAMTIPLAKVQAIYFGAAKPTPTATAPAPLEALDALRALRSVTESGISFRDYAPRVLDTKVKVDRYMSASPDDAPDLRGSIGLAMREYELASRVWSGTFQGLDGMATLTAIADNLEPDILQNCPLVKKAVQRVSVSTMLKDLHIPDTAPVGPAPWAVLWSCASANVAQADRLLVKPLAAPVTEASKVVAPKAASTDPVPGPPRARIANQ